MQRSVNGSVMCIHLLPFAEALTICVWLSVRQLHREFLRAGANVMQTFTFYASDDKLVNRGWKVALTVRFFFLLSLSTSVKAIEK